MSIEKTIPEILADLNKLHNIELWREKLNDVPMEKLFSITPELENKEGQATSIFFRLLTDDYEIGSSILTMIGNVKEQQVFRATNKETEIYYSKFLRLKEKINNYLRESLHELKANPNQIIIEALTIQNDIKSWDELYVKSFFADQYTQVSKKLFDHSEYAPVIKDIYNKFLNSELENTEVNSQTLIKEYIKKAQMASSFDDLKALTIDYLNEPLFDMTNKGLKEKGVYYMPLTIIFDKFSSPNFSNAEREMFIREIDTHPKVNDELSQYLSEHINAINKIIFNDAIEKFPHRKEFKFEAALTGWAVFMNAANEIEATRIHTEKNRLNAIFSIREKMQEVNYQSCDNQEKKNKKL